MGEHSLQILRRAAVGKSRGPVWLAAAAARVPRHGVPTAFGQRPYHAEHVVSGGIAFQTVGYDCQPPRAGPDPIQIQEIVGGCIDPFALIAHASDCAEQMREQRLQMAIGEKPGSPVSRISNNGHGKFGRRYVGARATGPQAQKGRVRA